MHAVFFTGQRALLGLSLDDEFHGKAAQVGSLAVFNFEKKNGKSYIPPSDWTLIQRRGQYGNSPDYFSLKLWDDYEKGFGCPAKGGASLKRPISFLFPIVLLQSSGLA